jgi:hypothetical protein
MADKDYRIKITYANHKVVSVVPKQTPPSGVTLDLDDTVTFEVTSDDCRVCFDPVDVFGSHIRLKAGTHGPYSPARTNVTISFDFQDYGTKCPPPPPVKISTYSIKVG